MTTAATVAFDRSQIVDENRLAAALEALDAATVDVRVKGFPLDRNGCALGELAQLGLNLLQGDLPFPVCVARSDAIQGNRAWMRAFLDRSGVALAPHAKTTMAPHLLRMQIEDGAWGFTVATAQQAAVLRSFGCRRLLIANQLVGRVNIDYLIRELNRDPLFALYVLVDSPEGVAELGAGLRRSSGNGVIRVLIEVGASGGRTGARGIESAMRLADTVASAGPRVQLCGIEAYESVFPQLDAELRLARIEALLDDLVEVARRCAENRLFAPGPVLLSAGGSEYFDRVAARLRNCIDRQDALVLLRSGCYIAHDHLAYARAFERLHARAVGMAPALPRLAGALEVWGVVQSRPEPTLALLTIGKRDVSYDFEMPIPLRWFRPGVHRKVQEVAEGYAVTRLNDQHAFLRCPAAASVQVGDLVGLGISHPCTTFDKWSLIYEIDEEYEVRAAFRTFF